MERRSADRRLTVPPEPEAAPPELVPGHVAVLRQLQAGAGNALVSRMLEHETDVAPHDPGDMSADLLAIGPGAFGEPAEPEAEGPVLTDVQVDAPPLADRERVAAKTPGPTPDPALVAWAAGTPTKNHDMAAWLLEGEQHKFLVLRAFYRRQIEDIAAGKEELTMYVERKDGISKSARRPLKTSGAPLPVLAFLVSLTRGRADRWLDDTNLPRDPVDAGELIRSLPGDAHHTGRSADLFPAFDWDGPNGPAQVIQVLNDLPPGGYQIGLPMQGEFFPESEYLANRQKKSVADAGPGGTPADVTQPSLIFWKDAFYTSKYDAAKGPKYPWADTKAGSGVASRLRSPALKTEIGALAKKGIHVTIWPDYPNHIHVQAN